MKKTIKLLLLAALAWPSLASAQGASEATAAPITQLELQAKHPDEAKSDVPTKKKGNYSNGTNNPSKAPSGPNRYRTRDFHYATVADGTSTNKYVPVYGYFYDNYDQTYSNRQTYSRMIYPAQMLYDAGMTGKTIRGITFYAPDGIKFSSNDGDGVLTCTIGTTKSTTFDDAVSTPTTTITTTLTPKKGDKELVFEFSSGLICTAGRNIWVEVRVTTAGTCDPQDGSTRFVGVNQTSNTAFLSFYYSGNQQATQQFLPKATFKLLDRNAYSSENVDFGNVVCGTSSEQTITITNNNGTASDVSWEFAEFNKDFFSTTLDESTTSIAADSTLTIPLKFTPGNTTDTKYGIFKFKLGHTEIKVTLRGKGVKTYDATVTPTSLDLGEVLVNDHGTAKVTLTNTGLQAITPTFHTDNEAFTVSASGTGDLAKTEARDYTVTFTPTAEQAYTSTLTIRDDAHGINLRVALKGKGVNTVAPFVVESNQNTTTEINKTVCDQGTITPSTQVPIYTNYMDYGCEGQMLYPESLIGLNKGDLITSLTFYATRNISKSYGSEDNLVTVKVGETTATKLSALITTGLETKCTASVWSGESQVTFTFDSLYEYKGGNLLIDLSCPNNLDAYWGSTTWVTVSSPNSSYYQSLNRDGTAVGNSGVLDYLPKMTIVGEHGHISQNEHVRAEEVAWGSQNVNAGSTFYSKEVTIYNPNSTDVVANLTIADSDPFSFAKNTTSKSQTMTLPANANTPLTLYFNPTAAAGYTGHLNIATGSHSSSTRLTGVGIKAGEIATRDSSFYASLQPYDWTDDNGNTHTSKLTEIATDPNQIIAMLREVYTNKDIPGNYKRGFTDTGGDEPWNDVAYTGVGTISHTGSDYTTGYSWEDGYGWGIPGNIVHGYDDTYDADYAHMDSTQYKPHQEGLTLLLVEMRDDLDFNSYYDVRNTNYSQPKDFLKATIERSIKSVRIISSSKRTGDGFDAGTLFKIDCDKMNKFCILAKGQMRYPFNSQRVFADDSHYYRYATFCRLPCYAYSPSYNYMDDSDETEGGFIDYNCYEPFYHMFEQFSPYDLNKENEITDVYQHLVNMESFTVPHDCASIPAVTPVGHHFRMYGEESEAADCQDVRDLMFFVPDYRMMKDDDRDIGSTKFLDYNTEHLPTMALYIIKQDEVKPVVEADDHYTLKLTWDSNMDEFLPSDEQEYQLWKLEVDEFGVERYVPVYKRNAQGQYWNATTKQWQNDSVGAQQVVLSFDPTSASFPDIKTYTEVYEERYSSSHMVTYAVRGQDKGHFLSLQMSNEQSFLIPGTDPAEMVMVSSATYYSRYNPHNEENCYSNKLQLKANPNMVNASYLSNSPTMTLNRSYSVKNANDETEVITEPVATIEVNYSAKTFTVKLANSTIMRYDFPNGKTSGEAAGYHANMHNGTDATQWTEPFTVDGGYVNFDFVIWDNFIADVSKNEHPGQYIYQLTFPTNGTIAGTQPQTNQAHSNEFRVPVYKTDSRINEPITLADVLGDTQMNPEYSPGDVTFDAQVQLSSKQNILRYDAYRWNEGETRYIVDKVFDDDSEQDLPPTGMAGNQGDFYTVTMNAIGSEDYYVGSDVGVSTASTTNWATFVDYYPTNANTDAGAYTYAPVVELFTRGYKVGSTTVERDDYNTYGGPLKNTAVGKLEVKPYEPTSTNRALMSDYYWTKNGEKYSYYNILLTFNALDVPEGYELYKVRAWRRVDRSVLDEQLESRQSRIDNIDEDGWLLYEDINYGDSLTLDGATKMSCSNLKPALLGERSTKIARPQNPDATGDAQPLFTHDSNDWAYGTDQEAAVRGETRATFGAKRLDLPGEDNDFPALHAEFKVRAYFTRNTNPLIAGTGTQNAPRRAESAQAMTGSDFDYYVAEGRTEVVEYGGEGVITGITGVKADANREVVGVTYVNTLGQQSSRPFEGVNMVVTRYSDGTTTTTKVVK